MDKTGWPFGCLVLTISKHCGEILNMTSLIPGDDRRGEISSRQSSQPCIPTETYLDNSRSAFGGFIGWKYAALRSRHRAALLEKASRVEMMVHVLRRVV